MHHDDHDLAHDLTQLRAMLGRRPLLQCLAGFSAATLLGCGDDSAASGDDGAGAGGSSGAGGTSATGGTSGSGTSGTGGADCSMIPEETAGPYPGDSSNGPNALVLSGIVRSDIRSSIGDATGTAEGIPLTVTLKVVGTGASCGALAGYAVYLWHCDRDGLYSMYTIADQNYLRGVQETDADGNVTFSTIFPACYPGRWPHIHFEIYPSLDSATNPANKVGTSQLALPEDACNEAFATPGYETSVGNLSQISLASDMVFSDGSSLQVAAVTGDVSSGYTATLTVAIG